MVISKERNSQSHPRLSILLLLYVFLLPVGTCFAQFHTEQLFVSKKNPHLLVTADETPVFVNSFTVWMLLRNGSTDDVCELLSRLKDMKLNAISMMVLDLNLDDIGKNYYGDYAFEFDENGLPDLSKPVVTPGSNSESPDEYDFWDHLDFVIRKANDKGMYVVLHPAWGDWFSGSFNGKPNKYVVFNESNAYTYGRWIGERYGNLKNVIWMLGGDRSAVYGEYDYRSIYSAMAKGVTEGVNAAAVRDPLISYHPRKWAPNSSEWFHTEKWLSFNSIQDTPYDQVESVPKDYQLDPVKPTWLCEGRYEGAITDWGIRYQAWQTVLSGGFGHTYGSDAWKFPKDDWRQYLELPGLVQMGYLYHAVREIWTDKQFLRRVPDQSLIIGDQGNTVGDGNTGEDGDGGGAAASTVNGRSDRITAMRGSDGRWAMAYTAAGKDIHLDLKKLKGKLNAYWFNPATGGWWVDGVESKTMRPFLRDIRKQKGDFIFDAPGSPGKGNDWVLILRK
ncbi:apiosidase-like domain-containing protein [Parapedobacter defluvii]|nr:MAG: DUF4038 domain-containing protein [Parapedobacter sp.]